MEFAAARRRPGPLRRRHRPRRGAGPGRAGRRARQWPVEGMPAQPRAWLMTVGKRKAIDPFRRDRSSTQVRPARPRRSSRRATGPSRQATRRRPHRRRPSPPDLRRLPPGALGPVLGSRSPSGWSAGSRPPRSPGPTCVPEPTIAQRIVRAKKTIAEAGVPFEVPTGDDRAARLAVGARGDLPHLQRGLLGHRRRRLDPPGAVRRGAPARTGARRPRARRARGARPGRADGDPVVAAAGPGRPARRARAPARPGPAPWDRLHIRRGLASLPAPSSSAIARALRPAGRHRGLPRPGLPAPRTPTGTQLVALYDALARVAPSPDRRAQPRRRRVHGRRARRRRSTSSSSSRPPEPSTATTCSTACGATCSTSWGACQRRLMSSTRSRPGDQHSRTKAPLGQGPGLSAVVAVISGDERRRSGVRLVGRDGIGPAYRGAGLAAGHDAGVASSDWAEARAARGGSGGLRRHLLGLPVRQRGLEPCQRGDHGHLCRLDR